MFRYKADAFFAAAATSSGISIGMSHFSLPDGDQRFLLMM